MTVFFTSLVQYINSIRPFEGNFGYMTTEDRKSLPPARNVLLHTYIFFFCFLFPVVLEMGKMGKDRLRAVPLFSYSPSRAERKKQAARKLLSFSPFA